MSAHRVPIGLTFALDTRSLPTRLMRPEFRFRAREHGWTRGGSLILPRITPQAVLLAASGAGKTTLLQAIAYGALAGGIRVVILDAKGKDDDVPRWLAAARRAGIADDDVILYPRTPWKLWTGQATDVNTLEGLVPDSQHAVFSERLGALARELHFSGAAWSDSRELLERLHRPNVFISDPIARAAIGAKLSGQSGSTGVLSDIHAALIRLRGKEDQSGFNFDTDFKLAVLPLKVSSDRGDQRLGVAIMIAFDAWLNANSDPRPTLLIVDEAGSILNSPAAPPAVALFEKMRSSGSGLITCGQSFESLGEDARQMINSGADLILGRLLEPEESLRTFGTSMQRESTEAVPGEAPVEGGSSRQQHTFLVSPDRIRTQPTGFFVIANKSRYVGCRPYLTQ